MKRNRLLALLANYKPLGQEEERMWMDTIQFVEAHPDCFERELSIGHVTGSGWVVMPDLKSALLLYHAKLGKWFQPGGHCDGDPDVFNVAKKEVMEETGLKTFSKMEGCVFDVDVHLIPTNAKNEAHYHYDIRFLFIAGQGVQLVQNSESLALEWADLDDIFKYTEAESIMRMVRKTRALQSG